MKIKMYPYDAGIEEMYDESLTPPARHPFTIRAGSSTEKFDSYGDMIMNESQPPPVPRKSADDVRVHPGILFPSPDHGVRFDKDGSTTMMSSSTWRRRHHKRSSRQVLEAKLPALLRGNLPAFSGQATSGGARWSGVGGGHAQHVSWITAARRHDHLHLEQRLEWKNLTVIFFSELFGTFSFLFFGLAINTTCSLAAVQHTQVKTIDLQALLVSSLGYGFSLAISAWVFFRISGGVQNPAITLALTLTGSLTWSRCIVLSTAQYVAGIAAAGVVDALLPSKVDLRTTLAAGVSVHRGFWLEFIMSAQLILTVLMLAAEKHKGTYLAPVGIGLALFITQLVGQPYTGASVNPARSLGPDVVLRKFESYAWLYYLSSYFAAVATRVFFLTLKWVRYETATPDQDADASDAQQQLVIDADGNVIAKVVAVPVDELHDDHRQAASNAERSVAHDLPSHTSTQAPPPPPPAAHPFRASFMV